MPDQPSAPVRIAIAAAATLVTLAAAAAVIFLLYTVTNSAIPFDTDEANHAADGWQIYHALTNLAPGELLRAVTDQSFYPPVHSFFVAAGYLLAGPSLSTSRLPTVATLVLTLLGLAWITFRLARRDAGPPPATRWLSLAGATFAVALAITNKTFLTHAVLVMQEMTGAFLGIGLLLVVDGAERTQQRRGRWIGLVAAALIAILLGLTKYSFGLFYVPAILAALVTAQWPWQASRRAWIEVTAVSAIAVSGFGLWLLVTDRATVLLFLTDHGRAAPLLAAENLLYFPTAWFSQYAASLLVAMITTLLAIIGAVRQWGKLAVRVAVWTIAAALISLTIARVQELRHLLPVTPAAWMLAGLGLVEVLRWLRRSAHGDNKVLFAVLILFATVAVSAIKPALALPADLTVVFEGAPAFSQAQDFALEQVDLNRPVLFIGDFSDQVGLMAVRWRAATLAGKNLWDLDVDYFPFEFFEHSMARTHRKAQIATVDPTFPREYMNEVLARNHYASLVELKYRTNYFGPRSSNPEDPLCPFGIQETWFDDWVVIVYDIAAGPVNACVIP